MLGVIGLGWTSGCGAVKGNPGQDAAVAADAPSVRRCDPKANFGRPVALASLNTSASEESADLSADELTMYFSSSRPGGIGSFDIYEATRSSTSEPFGSVVSVTGVNTSGEDRLPRVTADSLSLFATSKASSAQFYHVALATRASTTLAFSALQLVATVNGTTNDGDSFILPAGNVLYFASDRGGNYGLYRSSMAGGAFSAPTLVSGVSLDSPSTEGHPVVTPDELTLFFSSNRPGGSGNFDIYQATRQTVADGFGAPIALTSINTANYEVPNWISPDGCALYFTYLDPNLGYQLYVTMRGP